MDFKERVKVRNVIAKDYVALEKWNTVKDSLVKDPADRLRVSGMIKRDEYHEAILLTIQLWCSDQENPAWEQFIDVMRDNGLNKLAGELESLPLQTEKTTNCIWFGMNEVPDNFTGRLTDMETLHDLMLKSRDKGPGVGQFVAVTGLGGIGKSTLCTKYAYDYKELYQNVIWIHAETFDSMRTSFQSLGTHLGITRSQVLSIEDLVMAVQKYFSNKSCLFIFDNLVNMRVLDPFRPVNPWSTQPFVLITSRSFNVVRVSMPLKTLTEDEAISFILAEVCNSTQSDAKELAHLIECLPLALQQAVAYIREKFYELCEPTPIQKYMSLFKTSAAKLLNDEQFQERLIGYEKTTYTTWVVTLDHIEVISRNAVDLLQVLSFLNPDLISIKFTNRFMKEDLLEDPLMVLRKYSMISLEKQIVRIHRLVQRVVGLGLGEERRTEIVSSIVGVVWDEIKSYNFTEIIEESVSHGVHLAMHQHMNSMPSTYLENVCWYLNNYDNLADSLEISSRAVQHFTSVSGPNHFDTLCMMEMLGFAHFLSKNVEASLTIYENILQLALANTEIGKDHWFTLRIQEKNAQAYLKSDKKKSLRLYNELIPIMEKVLGKNNEIVLAGLHNKAIALMSLSRLNAAIQTFELAHKRRVSAGTADNINGTRAKFFIALLEKGDSDKVQILEKVFQDSLSQIGERQAILVKDQNLLIFLETMLKPQEITSRILAIVPFHYMHIDMLTEAEAISFVLAEVNNSTQLDAEELVQLLECFPSALQQAIAYIKERFVEFGDVAPIQKYIQLFKIIAGILLSDKQFRNLNGHEKTSYTTWTVTRDQIGAKIPAAVDLLEILSFLNSYRISFEFMSRIIEVCLLEEPLMVLRKYSMLSLESGIIRIHRLVQKVVMLGLSEERRSQIVSSIVQVVGDELEHMNLDPIVRESVLHGLHLAMNQPLNSMPSAYLNHLCWYLNSYGDQNDSLELSSRAVQHFTLLFGPNHLDTLHMILAVGHAHLCSGNTSAALAIFEEIQQLAIANTEIDKKHWLALATQEGIAQVYLKTDPEKALELYEELIPIMERVFEKEDKRLIAAISNRASAMLKVGKVNESQTSFKLVCEMDAFAGAAKFIDIQKMRYYLADELYQKGYLELALPPLKKVFEDQLSLFGQTYPDEFKASCVGGILLRYYMDFKQHCVEVKNVILKDDVALTKWNTVKDSLVKNAGDRLNIGRLLTRGEYSKAILQTIQLWYSGQETASLEQFINVLTNFNLNQLAGRQTDIATLHWLMLKVRGRELGMGQLVAVTGLGGIGKSTICTKYAYEYRHLYQNVIWIQADTSDSMCASLQRLCTHLRITKSEKISIADLVKTVHKYFSNKSCLFIFDNLEELSVLDHFRPNMFSCSFQPFVLITSRIPNIKSVNCMPLHTWTEDEASSFVLDGISNSTESDADVLAQLLQCFPLALQQAVACIREQFVESVATTPIQKYITLFKTIEGILSSDSQFQNLKGYEKTTYTTWTVTSVHIDAAAVDLLEILSFMNPVHISLKFTIRLKQEYLLEEQLKVLRNYSMISMDNGMIQIHRLVQQMVVLSVGEEEDRRNQIISSLVQVIEDELKDYTFTDIVSESVSHGLHLAKHQQMNSMSSKYLNNLCWYLNKYGTYADSLEISTMAAQHFTSLSETNHIAILRMKLAMSCTQLLSGNDPAALAIFENTQQLAIANPKIGEEHWLTLQMQRRIAQNYVDFDPEKSLELYEELIPVMERVYGKDSSYVTGVMYNKAMAMMNQGRLTEALETIKLVHEMEITAGSADNINDLNTKYRIADLLYRKGDLEHSCPMIKEVFESRVSLCGENHPETIQAQNLMSQIDTKLKARLITNQILDIVPFHYMHLDTLTKAAAISFVLAEVNNSTQLDAEELVQLLEGFPPAMFQAIAYIRERFGEDQTPIQKYIVLFKTNAETLLCDSRFRKLNGHGKTAYITWTVTREHMKNKTAAAVDLLEILSFLNPDQISFEFTSRVRDVFLLEEPLMVLKKYSMISVKFGMIRIHRSVQQAVMQTLSEDRRTQRISSIVQVVGDVLKSCDMKDIVRESVSHGLYLAKKHRQTNSMSSTYLCDLCLYLDDYGNHDDSIEISSRAVQHFTSLFGPNHLDTLRMKFRMGNTNFYLGNTTAALSIFEDIKQLAIANAEIGTKHWLTLATQQGIWHINLTTDAEKLKSLQFSTIFR